MAILLVQAVQGGIISQTKIGQDIRNGFHVPAKFVSLLQRLQQSRSRDRRCYWIAVCIDLKATQSDIDTAIDGIEIGGRNYLRNSSTTKHVEAGAKPYHITTGLTLIP